jgi:hypothetical protein
VEQPERPLFRALYVVAFLLILVPVLDLVSTAWPIQPGTVRWRYGFLGLLANVMLTPLLGAMLASVVAYQLRHLGLLRGLSGLYVLGALLLGAALAVFARDALRLGPEIAAQRLTDYRAGAAIASGKYLLAMVGLAWLGLGGLKAASAAAPVVDRPRGDAGIVGGPRPG